MEAAPHPLQHARLTALHSFEVLDTDPERDFDEIVKLAAATCGTAISVVNFIDAERQWFKAETGLGVRETPLATSLCAHVILEEEFVEIRDTLEDPRMQDNPLCCREPGLRFYAGALLKTEEGLPLGTLCVLDYEPRELTSLQRDTLRVLSRQVMAILEARRALRTADVLRREVDHRVKNSLQSLSSFTRLQRRAFASEDAKLALSMVGTRIDALTHLHAQLYQTNEQQSVDLGGFIEKIGGHLASVAPQGVALEVETVPVAVSPQQAAAVGTYLNEFIANSYKHGFPDGEAGVVRVRLNAAEGDLVELVCTDTGVGFPDVASTSHTGLGMKIAEVVCMELESELDLRNSEDGVLAILRFAPQPL
ncbi:Two-component sensor histidine kinase, contains HisKA and HATPase domains [Tranquillimonas rosea]|uniref:Two-component sensor histidine kinase, contains HisKA and HATPase domains n=1 Tax=Tranquillimonas rosea TaxID=641238 RepID=A0A1H9WV63_9RHOB|nr:histidine kinase dimerization/phosphoacceptor domain -containing protein [Tranquillimonas rosea]SES37822.1 Two-component sensor histidine kinase, contains HisKA and HATPase domains [Tranquillimonas rosea]